MSLFSEMKSAANEAQGVLAQLQGSPAGEKNFLYNGAEYIGVFGQAQVVDEPVAAGGYRRSAILNLTATRAQFSSVPDPKKKITRIDMSPRVDYLVRAIDTHDPLHFVFQLVKVGD